MIEPHVEGARDHRHRDFDRMPVRRNPVVRRELQARGERTGLVEGAFDDRHARTGRQHRGTGLPRELVGRKSENRLGVSGGRRRYPLILRTGGGRGAEAHDHHEHGDYEVRRVAHVTVLLEFGDFTARVQDSARVSRSQMLRGLENSLGIPWSRPNDVSASLAAPGRAANAAIRQTRSLPRTWRARSGR